MTTETPGLISSVGRAVGDIYFTFLQPEADRAALRLFSKLRSQRVVRLSILKAAARERLTYDLGPLRVPAAWALYGSGTALRWLGRSSLGFRLLMRTHDAGFSAAIDRRIAREIREATAEERRGVSTGLFKVYDELISDAVSRSVRLPTQTRTG